MKTLLAIVILVRAFWFADGYAQETQSIISPQADLRAGQPAMKFGRSDGMSIFIEHVIFNSESALKFHVRHSHGGQCQGSLFISENHISYDSIETHRFYDHAFSVRRNEVEVIDERHSHSRLCFRGHSASSPGVRFASAFPGFREGCFEFVYESPEVQQGEKAPGYIFMAKRRAVSKSDMPGPDDPLEAVADFSRHAIANFQEAESEFKKLAFKIAIPATVAREQSEADSAVQSGQLREALQHYLTALQGLAASPPPEIEAGLRKNIIRVVLQLNPVPAIPEEGRRHAAYATAAVSHSTGPADLDDAINEWDEALRVAPWWPEAYYNAALVLEKRERYADSARYLQLYLLASPHAEDAQILLQKIYELEYLAKKQQAN